MDRYILAGIAAAPTDATAAAYLRGGANPNLKPNPHTRRGTRPSLVVALTPTPTQTMTRCQPRATLTHVILAVTVEDTLTLSMALTLTLTLNPNITLAE